MYINTMSTVVLGSPSQQTSVAEAEIIPLYMEKTETLVNFQMLNTQECHVSINNGAYIIIPAGLGIAVDIIHSLKIQEADITFTWIGTRK